jgi:hypothetical protein
MILKVSGDSLEKVESEFTKIIDSDMGRNEKFTKLFSLMAEGHAETQSMMKEGFVGLAIQNAELNAELKEQNKSLKDQLTQLQDQLAIVTEELQERKERERLVQERKEKWKNRKRLPKREPITREIYDSLIESSQKFKYSNLYQSARLRLALALLLVTGIRISELLPLKMKQVESLFTHNWISIDRAKRGPGNHKAFLTKEGARIMKDRRSDFELLQLWRDSMKKDKALQIDLKGLKNFELDSKSDGFGSFITAVFRQFEVLEDEECTEQELKDYVQNTLREIQPYL